MLSILLLFFVCRNSNVASLVASTFQRCLFLIVLWRKRIYANAIAITKTLSAFEFRAETLLSHFRRPYDLFGGFFLCTYAIALMRWIKWKNHFDKLIMFFMLCSKLSWPITTFKIYASSLLTYFCRWLALL